MTDRVTEFPSLTGNPVYFRTYSRFTNNGREQWHDTVDRMVKGLAKLGNLSLEQISIIQTMALLLKAMPSGRWCWVGGSEWLENPANFSGAYNCSSFNITSFERMAFMMSLGMQGVGTGTVLESKYISQLPVISTHLEAIIIGKPGDLSPIQNTVVSVNGTTVDITIGDSRQGWCDAYRAFLELSATPENDYLKVFIHLGHIRAAGTRIKGFGGVTNPIGIERKFNRVCEILNGALGRQLLSTEICLILDEAALETVAGNVRRSANMRQFDSSDLAAMSAKDNMWTEDAQGNWSIDPKKDAYRMGNHTRIFHQKPTLDECINAVTKQYWSGEGAIQWAGESVARANADLLNTQQLKQDFLDEYCVSIDAARDYLEWCSGGLLPVDELDHRMERYGINPCFAAGTQVLTRDGVFEIQDLVGKTVEVWDGDEWVSIDSFAVTGKDRPVHELSLSQQSQSYRHTVTATEYHTFILENGSRVELKDLKVGDRLKGADIPAKDLNNNISDGYDGDSFYVESIQYVGVAKQVYCCFVPNTHKFTLANGLLVGNCGEIIGSRFMCNLSEIHLNMLDPLDLNDQINPFIAGALEVAVLLHHQFIDPEQAYSRRLDPIVGVSFTGLFDFFVNAFGVDWLQWWQAGRPGKFSISLDGWYKCKKLGELLDVPVNTAFEEKIDAGTVYRDLEAAYLSLWRKTVEETVSGYCEANNLKTPNRCTTVQPAGTKSLLTNASPGWHPPKAAQFIRRMTFRREDPVALACIDFGYSVIPSQADKDENDRLLDDPFDPRCTEWLVEIPISTSWAGLEGVADIDISKLSALAQLDFYMQVQQYYVRHNTSATIEFREDEIVPLATEIHRLIQHDKGYISAALLSRFDEEKAKSFPRLPFEPIDRGTYLKLVADVASRSSTESFGDLLSRYDLGSLTSEVGPAGCDSDKCLMAVKEPSFNSSDVIVEFL